MNERDLLMIPGPINFDPAVLRALGAPTEGHTSPEFVDRFGEALGWMKDVFAAPSGEPFAITGSGTLAMDMAVCNMVEPGDRAVALSTGFFSDRMVAILEHYGAEVTALRADVGDVVPMEQVQATLERVRPKVLTLTHVDTSTGVAVNVKELARLGRQSGALVIVDGVCSIAGMEFQQEAWGVDIALTASQKAVGVPPGLALLVALPRAIEVFRARTRPVPSYFSDWSNWLPIMDAYLARKGAYFATPPVNMVYALHEGLRQIRSEGLPARIARHTRISGAFKAGIQAIGLTQVPVRPEIAATTMSAVYFPAGVDAKLIGEIRRRNVIVAGGIAPAIRDQYFRVGHMGVVSPADIVATLAAIEGALVSCGYRFDVGAGVAAAEKAL